MKKILFSLILVLAFAFIVSGETTGTISTGNATTGLYGSTSQTQCNGTADCGLDYVCFIDYDGTSIGASQGWCFPSGTSCAHSDSSTPSFTATSNYFCTNSTARRQCSSASWGSANSCSSGETCSAGSCNATGSGSDSGSGSGGGGGGGSNGSSSLTSSISITNGPEDFDLIQGESALKAFKVSNNGQVNLTLVKLTFTGIGGISAVISPEDYGLVVIGDEKTFDVNFSTSATIDINEYNAVASADSDQSASDTYNFVIRIIPSAETVQNLILPTYQNYTNVVADLETQISELELLGRNTTEMRNLLDQIKSKLNNTSDLLNSQDYFAANQVLNEVEDLISQLSLSIANSTDSAASPVSDSNALVIVFAIIILAIVAVIAYKFRPKMDGDKKPGFMSKITKDKDEDEFRPKEEEKHVDEIEKKIQKTKRDFSAEESIILKIRKGKKNDKRKKI